LPPEEGLGQGLRWGRPKRGKKRKEEERRGKKRKEEERRGKKRKEEERRGKGLRPKGKMFNETK
jgi:hypothetical protein